MDKEIAEELEAMKAEYNERVAEKELQEEFEAMKEDYEEFGHYGTKRHSGRYPWGSGDDPYQHEPFHETEDGVKEYRSYTDWLQDYNKLKKDGVKEKDMVEFFDFGTTQNLRAAHRAALVYARNDERNKAVKLQSEGKSLREIAKEMGYTSDSSIRSLLNEQSNINKNHIFDVAQSIKQAVDKYKRIDVGKGTEQYLGCTEETLEQALYILKAEYGYEVRNRRIEQMTNKGQFTTDRVAIPPNSPKDFLYNLTETDRIYLMRDYGSESDTKTKKELKPAFQKPEVMDRERVYIKYAEEGGVDKDGLIEIRPGVADISLNGAPYAQVRIALKDANGKPRYYMKGMAAYSNDIPEGYDIVFNSNRHVGQTDAEVFKNLKKLKGGEIDWENPFGSNIKEDGGQYYYTDPKTGEQKLSLINKKSDTGDWGDWSKSLPSQFLAKQPAKFVKNQLKYTIAEKMDELEEISRINNPVVKQKLLKDFAGSMDSQAVHLKAAALPRQKYQVFLPLVTSKDNEIYAPNFEDGSTVAVVRFPHEGPFQIPILKVNNKIKEGRNLIGTTGGDAVGFNKNVADKLSGADFDGDAGIVIPLSDKVNVSSWDDLEGLKGFDAKASFPPIYARNEDGSIKYDEFDEPIVLNKTISKKNVQRPMGEVSNLIMDMTLAGCDLDELTRAVKYSQTIIDSPKHKLDWQRAEEELGIKELKKKYQAHDKVSWDGKVTKGSTSAATLISMAKSQYEAPVHNGRKIIDPETGKYKWTRDDYKIATFRDKKTGELKQKVKTFKSNYMMETDDAYTLVRDKSNEIEMAYAEFANQLKAIANEARKRLVHTENLQRNPEAAVKYAAEVDSLMNQLKIAQSNRPREREAQALAKIYYDMKMEEAEELGETYDKEEEKKLRDKCLKKARIACGASRIDISISDKEWEAIQAGALSHTKVAEILDRANMDTVTPRALPHKDFEWTEAKANIAVSMADSGWTTAEIAERLGISDSTVNKFLKGVK